MKEEIDDVSKVLISNIEEYQEAIITDRAITSWKDGLKPCGRRLIKSLEDVKAYNNKPTIKSAKIVGDCMGKYHAHGDAGIATSLSTLVNQLYPLVYGHGNWGSLTEKAAATRYTECRLSDIGMKVLECSSAGEYIKNYSGDYLEYIDIPSRFPTFFVNGTEGIAIGIKVHIPDHNLEEIVNAIKYVLKHKDANTKDLLRYIKGPDYKYGGKLLSSKEDLYNFYENNEGILKFECHYKIEKIKKGYLLTVTDCCPGFYPDSFLTDLDKLYDEKLISYKNDSSSKDEPCKIEVIYKDESTFEDRIHKMLKTSVKYQIYSVDQTKIDSQEKDLDIQICTDNFVTLMKRWINWRKSIEVLICKQELDSISNISHKLELKLLVAENLRIVKNSLENDNTEEMMMKELKITKNDVSYILTLNLNSIRKFEIDKIKKDIENANKEISDLKDKIANPDDLLLNELKKLKEFYKPRTLEIE